MHPGAARGPGAESAGFPRGQEPVRVRLFQVDVQINIRRHPGDPVEVHRQPAHHEIADPVLLQSAEDVEEDHWRRSALSIWKCTPKGRKSSTTAPAVT